MSQVWNPFDADHVADPFPIYRRLRDELPLYHNVEQDFYALTRYEDVAPANADWVTYSSADGVDLDNTGSIFFGPGNVVEEDPPVHTQLRAVVRHHLTPKLVASLEPEVTAEAIALADALAVRLQDGETIDVIAELCLSLPLRVIGDLLGLEPDQQDELYTRFLAMFERESGSPTIPDVALAAAREVRATLHEQLEDRLHAPRRDLLTAIALGEVDGRPLTEEERVGMSTLIVGAGISTTKNLLSSIFWYVSHDAELRRRLEADDDVRRAIEEFLRYDSPIQNSTRVTTRDVELHGEIVPAGSRVTLVYGSANRDERQFPDADVLDLQRDVRRHFAFGAGVHMCIGAPLARLETRLVLQHALPRLPALRYAGHSIRSLKMNERGFEQLALAIA